MPARTNTGCDRADRRGGLLTMPIRLWGSCKPRGCPFSSSWILVMMRVI
jgi:hypothetical protein